MSPSAGQIILIILVILLIFGAGRLPRLMEDLAKGMKAFKKGMDDDNSKQVKSSQKSAASKKARSTSASNQGALSDQKITVFPAKKATRVTQNKNNLGGQVSTRAETANSSTSKSDKTTRMPSMAQPSSKTKPFTTPYNDQNSVDTGTHNDRSATKDAAKKSVSKVAGQSTDGTKSSTSNKKSTKKAASHAGLTKSTGSKTTDPKAAESEIKLKIPQKKVATKPKSKQSTTKQKSVSKDRSAKSTTVKSGTVKNRAVKKTN